MITASALPRLFACPGSAALPQARTTSVWAEAGTERHAEQEDAIAAGDLEALPPQVRALIPDDFTRIRAEVAFAFDVETGRGRELGVGIGRRYGALGPSEIPGTIDLLIEAPGLAIVIDWKGWEDVGSPEDNEQVALYAISAARALGLDEVTVAIVYLGAGKASPPPVTLDALDLDAFHERLVRLRQRVADQIAIAATGRLPDVSENPGCKHCPAAHVCPAKVSLIKRLVSGAEADDLELLLPLDDETARLAYERLGHARSLLKRIERAIYARAAESPIPLGGGKYLGRHRKLGNEQLDGEVVHQVLLERYGVATADTAVTRHATKTALTDALRFVAPKGKLTAVSKDVLADVRARGGSRRDEKDEVGEFSLALEEGEAA